MISLHEEIPLVCQGCENLKEWRLPDYDVLTMFTGPQRFIHAVACSVGIDQKAFGDKTECDERAIDAPTEPRDSSSSRQLS